MIHDSFNELIVPIRRFKLFKMSQHCLNSEGEFFGFAIFSFEGSRNLGLLGITQLCPFKLESFNLFLMCFFVHFLGSIDMPDSQSYLYVVYLSDNICPPGLAFPSLATTSLDPWATSSPATPLTTPAWNQVKMKTMQIIINKITSESGQDDNHAQNYKWVRSRS